MNKYLPVDIGFIYAVQYKLIVTPVFGLITVVTVT